MKKLILFLVFLLISLVSYSQVFGRLVVDTSRNNINQIKIVLDSSFTIVQRDSNTVDTFWVETAKTYYFTRKSSLRRELRSMKERRREEADRVRATRRKYEEVEKDLQDN